MEVEIHAGAATKEPGGPGGNRLRWHWFGTYDKTPPRGWFQFVAQGWDTGMTAEPTIDFSVRTTWGKHMEQGSVSGQP